MKKGKYSPEEILFLKENYPHKGKFWCMEKMNRTEGSIRFHAAKLGLRLDFNSDFFKEFQSKAAKSKVGKKRPEHAKLMSEYAKNGRLPTFGYDISDEERNRRSVHQTKNIKENGHPRGFLGGKHTDESKKMMSKASIEMWKDPNHIVNSDEHRQKISDRMMNYRANNKYSNPYSRTHSGTVTVGGKTFYVRSEWEFNISTYLEFLKGKEQIIDWEHEPKTFWFDSIKRGVRSYLTDFLVKSKDGDYFIEVKGWMDAKSKTKLKRMAKYYPEVKLELIDQKRYKEIAKSSSFIEGWGTMSKVVNIDYRRCDISNCENKHHSKGLCRKHFYKKVKS